MTNILRLIENETGLTFRLKGKEAHGACPFCGDAPASPKRGAGPPDRFVIWPETDRYWCRQCEKQGDSIQFLRDFRNFTFAQAVEYLGVTVEKNSCDRQNDNNDNNHNNHNNNNNHNYNVEPQSPPCDQWLEQAWKHLLDWEDALFADNPPPARRWLNQARGLTDTTLIAHRLGYNPVDRYVERADWGLPPEEDKSGRPKGLWLPRGVVIPWIVDGELWGLRIRRPEGDPKYYWMPGGTPALYNSQSLTPGRPVALLEGEIDALSIQQQAGDIASAVATGSTQGGRRLKWIARLSLASQVLIAYDTDDAGDKASVYWRDALENARRWRPYWGDANEMAVNGVNLRNWVASGLAQ